MRDIEIEVDLRVDMKGQIFLPKISVRGFSPQTFGVNDIEKKILVRDLLKTKIEDLLGLQQRCKGKRLWFEVTFYLYEGSAPRGKTKGKDLDNLLKIVIDVLPEYMDKHKKEQGLGLMVEDKDEMIFGIHAEKELVGSKPEEGMDIEIAEWEPG